MSHTSPLVGALVKLVESLSAKTDKMNDNMTKIRVDAGNYIHNTHENPQVCDSNTQIVSESTGLCVDKPFGSFENCVYEKLKNDPSCSQPFMQTHCQRTCRNPNQ